MFSVVVVINVINKTCHTFLLMVMLQFFSDIIYILHLLKLKYFCFLKYVFKTELCVCYLFFFLSFFVYRSTHVQDVILGLLRNCWKRGGVFYYNAVIALSCEIYCYISKRMTQSETNLVNCLMFSTDNGSMPTISSGPQNQQPFEVFYRSSLRPFTRMFHTNSRNV